MIRMYIYFLQLGDNYCFTSAPKELRLLAGLKPIPLKGMITATFILQPVYSSSHIDFLILNNCEVHNTLYSEKL